MSAEPTLKPTVTGEEPEELDDGEESDEYEVEVRKPSPDKVLATYACFFPPSEQSSFQITIIHGNTMVTGNRAKKTTKLAHTISLKKKRTRTRTKTMKRKEVYLGYVFPCLSLARDLTWWRRINQV